MKIIKPLTLGTLHKPYRHLGQEHFVITAVGFFRLGEKAPDFLMENIQWIPMMKALGTGEVLDLVMPKASPEVLLAAKAYSATGKPVACQPVSFCLGSVNKQLHVFGDREWTYGLVPTHQVGEAKPFAEMPIRYERAYGGEDYEQNPVGIGYTGQRFGAFIGQNQGMMPNIEYADTPVESHTKEYPPAGFGPLDIRWPQRHKKSGTYDQAWIDKDYPALPDDIDWGVYNAAAEDQWLDEELEGGEYYRLEGMHPKKPVIEGHLPDMRVRAVVRRLGQEAKDSEDVVLTPDTVWFVPDEELGVLIYRGQIDIVDSDALDVQTLMLAYEHNADAPRSLQHYRDVMQQRLDPQDSIAHVFNESQLTPEKTAEQKAARAKEQAEAEAQHQAQRQAHQDAAIDDFAEQTGLQPGKDFEVPELQPSPLPVIPQGAVARADFDLSETLEKAKALGEQAKKDGDAQIAEAKANQEELLADQPKASAEETAEKQQKDGEERIAKDPNAIDPSMFDALDAIDDAEQRAEAEQSLQAIAAQKRAARRAAPDNSALPEALQPEVAKSLGEQVWQMHIQGISLAGRDLAGVDLSGRDFTGADLRETMLEGANLSGCKFIAAKLSGAVLTEAIIDGCDFSGADLSSANLCGCKGKKALFIAADLRQGLAMKAKLPQGDFSQAQLQGWQPISADLSAAVFDGVRLENAALQGIKAEGSRWQGAVIEKSTFVEADLTKADFSKAQLLRSAFLRTEADDSLWREVRMKKVIFGKNTKMPRADFTKAVADECGWRAVVLSAVVLREANLQQCDFAETDMQAADLQKAVLCRSVFMQADLTCCEAADSDWFQAMCRKANFSDADLRRANMVQTEIGGAVFERADTRGMIDSIPVKEAS